MSRELKRLLDYDAMRPPQEMQPPPAWFSKALWGLNAAAFLGAGAIAVYDRGWLVGIGVTVLMGVAIGVLLALVRQEAPRE